MTCPCDPPPFLAVRRDYQTTILSSEKSDRHLVTCGSTLLSPAAVTGAYSSSDNPRHKCRGHDTDLTSVIHRGMRYLYFHTYSDARNYCLMFAKSVHRWGSGLGKQIQMQPPVNILTLSFLLLIAHSSRLTAHGSRLTGLSDSCGQAGFIMRHSLQEPV